MKKPVQLSPVELTYEQVKDIIYEMGWEPEDAAVFFRMARRLKHRAA